MAPAWPALANGEHLCGVILIERDRLYASKLISLFADCFGLAGRAFVRRVWLHFSARLHANPPLLQILQLGPEWEPPSTRPYCIQFSGDFRLEESLMTGKAESGDAVVIG